MDPFRSPCPVAARLLSISLPWEGNLPPTTALREKLPPTTALENVP